MPGWLLGVLPPVDGSGGNAMRNVPNDFRIACRERVRNVPRRMMEFCSGDSALLELALVFFFFFRARLSLMTSKAELSSSALQSGLLKLPVSRAPTTELGVTKHPKTSKIQCQN
jgi:hypothetical protein